MKKIVLTCLSLVAGAMLAHSQGLITLNSAIAGTMVTNGSTIGLGTGNANGATSYFVELLDMTSTAWAGLSSSQQANAYNLLANPTSVSLWTDSGISGAAGQGLSAGKVNAVGGTTGTSAANWGAPTGGSYSTGPTDFYTIVGWSSTVGANWAAVLAELQGGSLTGGVGAWFGQTGVAFNEAGGGSSSLPAVSVFGTSATSGSGLAGSGLPAVAGSLVLNPIPEPTTLALAGLGGLSMLFLRRRKS